VQYKAEEPVKLWVNKVGPYNNPQETYNYYSLPFCQPAENPAHKWGGLGEVLGGNELIDSQLDIKFLSMSILFSLICLLLILNCLNACSFLLSDQLFSFISENVDKDPICTIELDAKKVQQFTDAIESSYWFELFIGMKYLVNGFCVAALFFLALNATSGSDILCTHFSSFAYHAKSPR
jgi:transmembrane 9 superfamily protein 3